MARPKRQKAIAPSTQTIDLAKELAEHVLHLRLGENFNPFKVLAEIAADDANDAVVRSRAASELAAYYRPKLRGIEVASSHQEKIEIEIVGACGAGERVSRLYVRLRLLDWTGVRMSPVC